MTQEQFNEYLLNMEALSRFKEKNKTIQIEWETDIAKIDLSVLRSKPTIPRIQEFDAKIRLVDVEINMMDLEWVHSRRLENLFNEADIADLEDFVMLYKVIESGIKIIPPIARKTYRIINGKITENYHVPPLMLDDGGHRASLAWYLCLRRIPIFFIKTINKCSFDRALWNINCNGEIIELSEKNGSRVFKFPLENCFRHFNENDYRFSITPLETAVIFQKTQ